MDPPYVLTVIVFCLCDFFCVQRARVMQSEVAESIDGDVDGFASITRENESRLPEEGQLLTKNERIMRTLFPVDVQSVKVFAVSKSMSLIDLNKSGKSVGLTSKSTGRKTGHYCHYERVRKLCGDAWLHSTVTSQSGTCRA